jgi:hypothetical protein
MFITQLLPRAFLKKSYVCKIDKHFFFSFFICTMFVKYYEHTCPIKVIQTDKNSLGTITKHPHHQHIFFIVCQSMQSSNQIPIYDENLFINKFYNFTKKGLMFLMCNVKMNSQFTKLKGKICDKANCLLYTLPLIHHFEYIYEFFSYNFFHSINKLMTKRDYERTKEFNLYESESKIIYRLISQSSYVVFWWSVNVNHIIILKKTPHTIQKESSHLITVVNQVQHVAIYFSVKLNYFF